MRQMQAPPWLESYPQRVARLEGIIRAKDAQLAEQDRLICLMDETIGMQRKLIGPRPLLRLIDWWMDRRMARLIAAAR